MHIIFLIKHTYTNFFGYKAKEKEEETKQNERKTKLYETKFMWSSWKEVQYASRKRVVDHEITNILV